MECKRCYKCKFFTCTNYGYSNYTVLETGVSCLKNKFEPIDESYSWEYECNSTKDADFFKNAETCSDYKEGDGLRLDVEYRNSPVSDYTSDPEIIEIVGDNWSKFN